MDVRHVSNTMDHLVKVTGTTRYAHIEGILPRGRRKINLDDLHTRSTPLPVQKRPSTDIVHQERERNVLFNDARNTFYLWLYGVRHMVKDHSDSTKGNPLPPHRLLLSINSKGSFICTIPQTG